MFHNICIFYYIFTQSRRYSIAVTTDCCPWDSAAVTATHVLAEHRCRQICRKIPLWNFSWKWQMAV